MLQTFNESCAAVLVYRVKLFFNGNLFDDLFNKSQTLWLRIELGYFWGEYSATLLMSVSTTHKAVQVYDTVKILKFGTPQTIAIIVLKIEKFEVTLH